VSAQWETKQENGGLVITGYTGNATAITIPDKINGVTVVGIGGSAFANIPLARVTIPNSVTAIGDFAFSTTQLTSVTIPNSVTAIGDGAFADCSSLTAISVDVRNPTFSSVDGVLFSKDMKTLIAYPGGKSSSYMIPNGVTAIGDVAFGGAVLTSITIPNSVTTIGDVAFGGAVLTSITLPNSVTTIGMAAFSGCLSLTSIGVDVQNSAFSSVDGVLFSKDMKTLIAYPGGKSSSYTILNGVITIGEAAFAGTQLTSVTIPNSVTTIEDFAFADTQLTNVTIPRAATLGFQAFDTVEIIRR
jgi:hypothetical protein